MAVYTRNFLHKKKRSITTDKGGQAVSIEQRILNIAEEPISIWWYDRRELRAIALDARKLEDRLKQLEQENDAMRADLLLWNKAGIGFTTEDKP
jgi:hypothetical protein